MSSSRRPSRRVPPKGRSLRNDPRTDPFAEGEFEDSGDTASTVDSGPQGIRPGSRAANRAAKRAVSGVRPKTGQRGGSGRRRGSSTTPLIFLGVAAAVIVAAVILLGNPFGTPAASPSPSAAAVATSAPSHGDGTCPTEAPAPLAAGDVRTVTIETTKGTIVMKIDGASAPNATGNFVALAACHYFDGIVFHRLVPGFVIQGGDPEGTGGGGPGYTIKDDPLVGTYHRGTIAMARTALPDSQGSQFFIVLSDDANAPLTDPQNAPYPYAILGEVTSGMDVVDAIAAMPNAGSPGNEALEPVTMTKVTVTAGPASSTAPTASAAASPAPTAAPSQTTAP
jgi:cyclophilin family peptidyl-prolyl cis-trans isomerase